jgi:hypothetical protein
MQPGRRRFLGVQVMSSQGRFALGGLTDNDP